jgi:hypothetical protein
MPSVPQGVSRLLAYEAERRVDRGYAGNHGVRSVHRGFEADYIAPYYYYCVNKVREILGYAASLEVCRPPRPCAPTGLPPT